MNLLGLDISMKNFPKYDPSFLPFIKFIAEYKKSVAACGGCPLKIALERDGGQVSVYETAVHGDCDLGASEEASRGVACPQQPEKDPSPDRVQLG